MTTDGTVKEKYLPPAVAVDCDATRLVVPFQAVFVVGAMVLLMWSLGSHQSTHSAFLTLGAFGFCGFLSQREFQSVPLDRLAWSPSNAWSCKPKSTTIVAELQACSPHVVLDLQRVLLLRVKDAHRNVHWVWMRRGDKAQWHRLRCALFNSVRT